MNSMEKLIIKNFAGIKYLEMELNKINIILGPQASGKSISAKMFFYFKSFFEEIRQAIEDNKSKRLIDKEQLNRFITYFPKESWPNKDFSIRRVLNKHKLIDSPYNTYKIRGIPPGPISIPSISAIDAVLDFDEHNYIYFCAKSDFSGYHNFASTLSQHNKNARLYQQALDQRKIYR